MTAKYWKPGMILFIPLLLILWRGWEDSDPVRVNGPPQQPGKGQSKGSAPSIQPNWSKASLPDWLSPVERKETKS